jgi:glutaredoxin
MTTKIQMLYILDCPWCLTTKDLIKECVEELGIDADVEEILIDTEEKARKHNFAGSPTIRVNGKDIQQEVIRDRCLPCEELANTGKTTEFVERECGCGCRIYHYKGKLYPYPPKEMILEALKKLA